MPVLKTEVPRFERGETTPERVEAILNYLNQLQDSLNYVLQLLQTDRDTRNLIERSEEGLRVALSDTTGALNAKLEITADGLTSEVAARTNADEVLSSWITQNATSISSEVTRATSAEGELSSRITQNAESISSEVTARQDVDTVLGSRITQTAEDITAEVTRATGAEGSLSSRITQNATSISSEVTARQDADTALGSRITQTAEDITAEVTRATGAEETLSTRITANAEGLTSKVSSTDYNGETVASLINQTESTVKILAEHLQLTGYITATDLAGNGTTEINGANVNTGKVAADHIALYGDMSVYTDSTEATIGGHLGYMAGLTRTKDSQGNWIETTTNGAALTNADKSRYLIVTDSGIRMMENVSGEESRFVYLANGSLVTNAQIILRGDPPVNRYGIPMTPVALWVNDSPDNSCANGWASGVPDISGYNMFFVEIEYSISYTKHRVGTWVYAAPLTPVEPGEVVARPSIVWYDSGALGAVYRQVFIYPSGSEGSQVYFGAGVYATSSNLTENNNYAIPTRILGMTI